MNPIQTITHLSAHMNIRRREGAFRYATGMIRSLPYFIIIGAQKSGTTSLFKYIEQHPQIELSKTKEVHYFDNHYAMGKLWYRSHFPLVTDSKITGEASPYYLCYPHCAKRIHQMVPNAKLIAVLRNPTERAISSYFHQVRQGKEKLPIMEALQKEEERIQHLWEKILQDEMYTNRTHQRFSYKKRGLYLEQLERFWKYFDPDNLLILSAEQLFTDPKKTLQEVFTYLGADPDYDKIDLKRYTVGVNREDVPSSVYDYLNEYFKPFNQKLYQRLGKDFGW